jgi:tripartite-type tricarboxylate transporter receptor subunit TctC
MLTRRHLVQLSVASALAPLCGGPSASEQGWPHRPVRLVVPLAAGGAIDATARIVGARLSDVWGQQVVIENKPGAGGNVAAEYVARSAPDGYTLYIPSFSHATNRFLYPSLSYDPVTDFAPVTLIGIYPNIMIVPVSSPARTVSEFIAFARANKGKVSYASSGHGTSLHLAGELFKRMTGIEMTHVPYRGGGPAFNDLIPGRVDVMINLTVASLPLVKNGQLRALGVATAQRVPALPELPTIAESGVPGFEVSSWAALFSPAKTPTEIVRKVHADTAAVLAEPAVKQRLEEVGVQVVGSTPDALASHLKAEMNKWGPIIRQIGITIRD